MAGTMPGRGQEGWGVVVLAVGKEKKAEVNTPSEGALVEGCVQRADERRF